MVKIFFYDKAKKERGGRQVGHAANSIMTIDEEIKGKLVPAHEPKNHHSNRFDEEWDD